MSKKSPSSTNELVIPLPTENEYLALKASPGPARYLRIISADRTTEFAYWPAEHLKVLTLDQLLAVFTLGSQVVPYVEIPGLGDRLKALIECYIPGVRAFDFETHSVVLENGNVLEHQQVDSLRQALARLQNQAAEEVPAGSQRSAHLCIEGIGQLRELISALTTFHAARLHPRLIGFENQWVRVGFKDGEVALLYPTRSCEPLPRHLAFDKIGWRFIDADAPIRSVAAI